MTTSIDQDAALAAVDLIGRTGAKSLQVGYLHDDVPVDKAAWYASVLYQGTRVIEENHRGPVEAVEALARRLMTGGRCRCGALVALSDDGAVFYPGARMADGSTWDEADARAAGTCRWTREGARWVSACGAGR